MLVKVTDIKGNDRWINAAYVRLIRWRSNRTEIWVAGNTTAILIDRPLDEVAEVLNAAMPVMDLFPRGGSESGGDGGLDGSDPTSFLTLLG
ncbi:MAG: hypothetical protein AAGG07_02255 [Planctomycetota bacterium]